MAEWGKALRPTVHDLVEDIENLETLPIVTIDYDSTLDPIIATLDKTYAELSTYDSCIVHDSNVNDVTLGTITSVDDTLQIVYEFSGIVDNAINYDTMTITIEQDNSAEMVIETNAFGSNGEKYYCQISGDVDSGDEWAPTTDTGYLVKEDSPNTPVMVNNEQEYNEIVNGLVNANNSNFIGLYDTYNDSVYPFLVKVFSNNINGYDGNYYIGFRTQTYCYDVNTLWGFGIAVRPFNANLNSQPITLATGGYKISS